MSLLEEMPVMSFLGVKIARPNERVSAAFLMRNEKKYESCMVLILILRFLCSSSCYLSCCVVLYRVVSCCVVLCRVVLFSVSCMYIPSIYNIFGKKGARA